MEERAAAALPNEANDAEQTVCGGATFQDRCEAVYDRLEALGVSSSSMKRTEESDSNTAMLDTIIELLQLQERHHNDLDTRGEELRAAEREISVQNRHVESLRDEVTSMKEETRKWRLQLDMMREEHREEKAKLVKLNKGLEKERMQLQGKDSQYLLCSMILIILPVLRSFDQETRPILHSTSILISPGIEESLDQEAIAWSRYIAKLRKVEGEVSRLKDQLQKAQNPSKGRKDRGGIAMVRVLPAVTRTTNGQGRAEVSDVQRLMDDAHAAYTETLSELRNENECLRDSLQALQEELVDACNDAVNPRRHSVHTVAERSRVEGGVASRGMMLLPIDLMQNGVEQQVRTLVQSVRELLASAATTGDRLIPLESPSLAQKAAASLAEVREQLSAEQAEAARLQAALAAKSDRLLETERMCALLRDAAHKQLGGSGAAGAIRLREEACDQRERALEAEAAAVAEQAESNAVAAEQIDKQRAVLEADSAAVAASLSAWERGSVGADGTPLSGKGSAADASPYIAQFLRRLSGISAPTSSPAINAALGSARKSAKMTITPHKTSMASLPVFSPKAPALTELNKQFANTLNQVQNVRTGSPCKRTEAVVCGKGSGALVEDGTSDSDGGNDAQPDLDFDKIVGDDVCVPELSANSQIDSESLCADEDVRVVGDGGVGEQDFAKLMAAAGIGSR